LVQHCSGGLLDVVLFAFLTALAGAGIAGAGLAGADLAGAGIAGKCRVGRDAAGPGAAPALRTGIYRTILERCFGLNVGSIGVNTKGAENALIEQIVV
jgi:hypothetical protein